MTTDVSTWPLNDNMIDRGKAFNSSIHQPSYSTSLCPRFQVIDKFMSGQNRLGNINSEFQSRVKSHLQSCAPEDPTDKKAPLKTEDVPGTSRKRKTPSPTRPDEVNFIPFGLFSPTSPFHITRPQRAALSEHLCPSVQAHFCSKLSPCAHADKGNKQNGRQGRSSIGKKTNLID